MAVWPQIEVSFCCFYSHILCVCRLRDHKCMIELLWNLPICPSEFYCNPPLPSSLRRQGMNLTERIVHLIERIVYLILCVQLGGCELLSFPAIYHRCLCTWVHLCEGVVDRWITSFKSVRGLFNPGLDSRNPCSVVGACARLSPPAPLMSPFPAFYVVL